MTCSRMDTRTFHQGNSKKENDSLIQFFFISKRNAHAVEYFTFLALKSTPTVEISAGLNVSYVHLMMRLDLPTPESPRRRILKRRIGGSLTTGSIESGGAWCVGAGPRMPPRSESLGAVEVVVAAAVAAAWDAVALPTALIR
jgi:hypothetical protein